MCMSKTKELTSQVVRCKRYQKGSLKTKFPKTKTNLNHGLNGTFKQ